MRSRIPQRVPRQQDVRKLDLSASQTEASLANQLFHRTAYNINTKQHLQYIDNPNSGSRLSILGKATKINGQRCTSLFLFSLHAKSILIASLSRSCWCAQAGHQMSLCVEHMACCLFGAMCSHVDCLSPPILLLNHCFSGSSCVSLVTLVCLPI